MQKWYFYNHKLVSSIGNRNSYWFVLKDSKHHFLEFTAFFVVVDLTENLKINTYLYLKWMYPQSHALAIYFHSQDRVFK